MLGLIPVGSPGALAALRGFLRRLLESGVVTALYVPLETDSGAVAPALVVDPARLEHANPLAPVMPINGARAVSALTGKRAPARLGAVLRPCEIRAVIELAKLHQASLDDLVMISLDCDGVLAEPVSSGQAAVGGEQRTNGNEPSTAHTPIPPHTHTGPSAVAPATRETCQMCTQPVPAAATIHLRLFGADVNQAIPVELPEAMAAQLGLAAAPASPDRQAALDHLLAEREQARTRILAAMQARLAAEGGFAEVFAGCIRCHGCMTACPLCYCKTCLFRTPAFDHAPEHYVSAARRKGAVRLLGDGLLFHLTRLSHMSTSCVGCGACSAACPAGIPVGTVFTSVAAQVQAGFNYVPGRAADEPLPLATFQASEWPEIGESA